MLLLLLWHLHRHSHCRLPHHAGLLHTHHRLHHWLHHGLLHHGLLHGHHHRLWLHHHWLLHHHRLCVPHLHHLLGSHLLHLSVYLFNLRNSRRPDTPQVDLPRLLALILDREPFIEATICAQGRYFNSRATDGVTAGQVLIEHRDGHIVANVLHIKLEGFVPFRCLAATLQGPSSYFDFPCYNLGPRVHLTEPFCVSGQFGLDHMKCQFSCCCHPTNSLFLVYYYNSF